MPKQRKLLSLLFSENQVHHSWLKISSAIIFFFLFFFYLGHIAITLTSKHELDSYAEDIFAKSKQLDFQIKNSFSLTAQQGKALCTPTDINVLREALSKYYYLGDIGRVLDGEVICTAKKSILKQPQQLDGGFVTSPHGIKYWNSQNQLFNNYNKPPMFSHGNTIVFISSAYLADLDSTIPTNNGSGGYLYLKNSDYIFKIYGKIDHKHIAQAHGSDKKLSALLLLPGSIITSQLCDKNSDICLMSVIKAHGISNLSYLYLFIVILAIFVFSLLSTLLVISTQNGPNSFIRKLRNAIKTGKIYPVYQPKIDINSGQIIGVEALARWKDSTIGFISPDLFISIAEQANLIKPLTESFIKKAFAELKLTLEQNSNFSLSINVSADVLIDKQFLTFLKNECGQYRFKPNQIILEITERVSSNSSSLAKAASLSKQAGFLISLDDFGTGYSNLAWLSQVEPDEIKIDKMFTQAVGTETVNSITLNGMFSMLDHLNVKVVFEGIETEHQKNYIQQRVPDAIGQGWLFSKPLNVDDLTAYTLKSN